MSILVGLTLKWSNCVGAGSEDKTFFECLDIHEAAVATLKRNWSTGWQCQYVSGGEFHDTLTQRTWTVDGGGHTQKDYRREFTGKFKKRWEMV